MSSPITASTLAAAILSKIKPGAAIGTLPISGTPPNLRSLARAVIVELDPSASTSWVALADAPTLRAYLTFNTPPKGVTPTPPVSGTPGSKPGGVSVTTTAGVSTSEVEAIASRVIAGMAAPLYTRVDKLSEEIKLIPKATETPTADMAALKARVDTLHGSVLEALDTAKAIADEAAKRAAEAAKSAASAATGGAVDPEKLGELLERAVKAASAAAAAPKLTAAAKSAVPDKPAPKAPKLTGKDPELSAEGTSPTPYVEPSNDSPVGDEDHVMAHIELFCAPGAAHKPVIVKGEAGGGKTFGARLHARKFDCPIEIGLHPETEGVDLLGQPRLDGSWQDGPLSEAFREAAAGKTVLVILDEFYLPRNTARGVLKTATSPFEDLEGREFYVLRTGRAIPHPEHADVYESEVLYAPKHLLAIIATTNVGSQYDVSVGDPAEKRRFAPVHIDVTEPIIRRVLGKVLSDPKHPLWGIREALIDGCVGFWRACRELRKTDRIEIVPTVSTFCEALKHPAVRTPQKFSDILLALGLHVWVGEDLEGSPIPEQVSSVTSALRSSLAPIL